MLYSNLTSSGNFT